MPDDVVAGASEAEMGTVGINFGAATSGAGFDVAATVTSILALSSAIETPWQTQLTSLKAQDTALSGIGTDLATLSTAMSSLTNFDGVLAQKEGSSSDSSVLALSSASSSAIAGSHTIAVTQLAQTGSNYSDSVANASDVLSGSLTIQVGRATTPEPAATAAQTIDLSSVGSSPTLAMLASYINNGTYGVTATVVADDSGGSRLSLVSSTSGAAGGLTIGGTLAYTPAASTTATTLGFTTGQVAQDAILSVDGLPTTSASNTVTNAIGGVTFQLLSTGTPTTTTTGGVTTTTPEPVQVQITNNNSAVETAVQAFVTAYNTVAGDIKTQAGNNSSGSPEPLYGDPTMSLIQSQLSTALFGGGASGAINSVQQLGISANQDGTLTLDTSTLDSILNSNYADVTGFFQNTGSWGQGLSTALGTLGTASPTGAISLELAQNSTIETGLNTNVTNENALIATEKTNLTAELNTANQELQAIPQQLNEVNEIYSAVTGYNQNPNG
jgi:flagellar hook-associated protein 2